MTDHADHVDASSERSVLDDALATLEEHAEQQTDGRWLEDLTRDVAPRLRDWNVDGCWRWGDWPERDEVMPEGTPAVDVGIDLVARRRDDGGWIAIQVQGTQTEPARRGRSGRFRRDEQVPSRRRERRCLD